MSLAVGGGIVVLMTVAGWGPMSRLAPAVTRVGRLSVALAFGAAITGLVQIALSVVGVPSTIWVPVALAVASLLGRRRLEPPECLARPVALVMLVVAVVGTSAAVGLPFRSDGSKFWAPKARELARVGASESALLHDADRLAFHRGYPLLVPAVLAPAFAHSPEDASTGPKFVLHALTLALLGVMADRLRRDAALLAAFAALPLFVSTAVRESAVAAGFLDAVVALYLLLVVEAVEQVRRGSGSWRVIGLFGAALMCTKLEGSVELALVLAAWLALGPVRKPVVAATGFALLLTLPMLVLRWDFAPDPPVSRIVNASQVLARSIPVVAGLGGRLVDVSTFGLFPLLLATRVWKRPMPRLLTLLAIGFLVAVYLTTTMHAGRHVHTSAHRLILHWLPALALLTARRDE